MNSSVNGGLYFFAHLRTDRFDFGLFVSASKQSHVLSAERFIEIFGHFFIEKLRHHAAFALNRRERGFGWIKGYSDK